MTKYSYIPLTAILSFLTLNLSAQFTLPFGNISIEDLSNKPYKPDPGAAAIVLSDIGVASMQYQKGLYIEFERDLRIRIVNSNGYEYGDIEIPVLKDDNLDSYRASTFNLRNGEKVETIIPKKSFIIEKSSSEYSTLKFNFQDVHEGSVIEFSYKMRLRNSSLAVLIPWEFQSEVPVVSSAITIAYPDKFVYKSLISGTATNVQTSSSKSNSNFFGEGTTVSIRTWSASNVPAFKEEPNILSEKEHLTKVTFEIARIEFPDITINDISPTYQTINEKLLDRFDFGIPMEANFKSLTDEITAGAPNDLTKLKKIHKYVSNKVLWNGWNDFTTNKALRTTLRKEKGSAADINMILITMLKSAGLKADPVILSTRSHGSLNKNSAMLQQFNYLVAAVTLGDKIYIVDATNPLSPFNLLPFNCLNNMGRLIHLSESRFVELKNIDTGSDFYDYNFVLDDKGSISGKLKYTLSGYSAYNVRYTVKLEGENGYLDLFRLVYPYSEVSDFRIANLGDPDSDVILTSDFKINNGAQIVGDKMIFNVFLSLLDEKSPFYSAERKFAVDFGYPVSENYSLKIKIPDGYSVVEKPSDKSFSLGQDGGKYEFSCMVKGNEIKVNGTLSRKQTVFQPSEYPELRSFYEKMLRKESEMIVLQKNPVITK